MIKIHCSITISLFYLVCPIFDLHGQSLSSVSPTFQYFQQISLKNPQTGQNNNQSGQTSFPEYNYVPQMGGSGQSIYDNVQRSVPMYGSGLNPQQNQAASQAYIIQRMQNDPLYQTPNTTLGDKQFKQIEEVRALSNEDNIPAPATPNIPEKNTYLERTIHYRNAMKELMLMKDGTQPFSIRRAVFIVENAYHNNKLDYKKFLGQISAKVNLCKDLMQAQGIKMNDNLGKNYVIQKLYSEKILIYKNDTVISRVIKPFQYDFQDFMGNEDWTKMFVTKLLKTGKGQCHSLPLNYLCIAEGLGAKAYLSFAPEHSYIMFPDNEGHMWNFETTNGSLTSDKWVMASGFINAAAIQNNLYMSPLNQQRLLAFMIGDLLMGYTHLFYYDDFVKNGVNEILRLDPTSLQGLVMKADFAYLKTKKLMAKEGITEFNQLQPNNPAFNAYNEWQTERDKISDVGYMGMPKNAYENWLLTLRTEEQKQEQKKLRNTVIGNVKKRN